jgi:hypothetical protein
VPQLLLVALVRRAKSRSGPNLATQGLGGDSMPRIELEEHEATVLARILEDFVSETRMEVANTDSQEFRDDLKEREKIAKNLLDKLGRPIS